ncbi:hypothetical protein cypCar_00019052 [Cyprinus carpio]|nr:hypothetical protein cypCar_00019052 [Cyprinus carpio]
MSSRIAFQTQLASIMEVLANAAVAEICKLVDDDYAVINLQMTQCQRENKALKRKLHILELKMARGFAERRINSLSRTNRVQVSAALSDKYRNQTNDVLYGAQFNSGLWRGGGTDSAAQQAVNESNSMTGDAVLSEADTVLIKDEMFEEDQAQQRLFIRDGGVKETPSQTGEACFGDVQMVKDDAQVSGMQQPSLEVSGSDTALKSEPEFESVKGISQEPVESHPAGKFDLNGKSSPMRDYLMQGSDKADSRLQSCTYVNNARSAESQCTGPLCRSEVIEVDSAEEGEEISVWASKVARGKSQAPRVYPQYMREEHQDSRILLPPSNPPLQQGQVEVGEPETIVIKEDLNDQWERSQAQAVIVQDAESNTEFCSGRLSSSPARSTDAPGTEKPIEVEFSHLSENGQDRSQRTNISPSTGLRVQGE